MILAPRATRGFNTRLAGALQRLSADVGRALGANLVAIVLGGGYGRGEGAVVRRGDLERAYNDIDLTVVVRQPLFIERALAPVAGRFGRELEVEVDFSRPLTVAGIRHWPHWLMWHDLLNGHVVLRGPGDVVTANAPAFLRAPVPRVEALRLLLNRGAGLLWALRVARRLEPAPDSDFVRRNFYKCALALGDAALILNRAFTTRYHGRELLLDTLLSQQPSIQAFIDGDLYRDALTFKLGPDEARRRAVVEHELVELAGCWGEALLYCERLRTGRPWQSLDDYARWSGPREPEQASLGRWPRNLVRNLQGRRLSIAAPREALFRQLPALLGLSVAPLHRWHARSASFLELWRRVS